MSDSPSVPSADSTAKPTADTRADLAFAPLHTLQKLVRSRHISPLELTNLYLDRIDRHNPQLGSYFSVAATSARALATQQTEQLTTTDPRTLPPLFGIPIAIKDLNPAAGLPWTAGLAMLRDRVAPIDDAVTGKLRQAGAIILGKTALSELGSLPYSEPDGFPPARNPWQVEHTPGGSSGGAAAAVAAGLCAIAQGSDGGGSLRGPAFCCGVVSIKPSRGRVSHAPVGDYPGALSTDGPLVRCVLDAAIALDLMSGYVTGDPYWLPDPPVSFAETARRAQDAQAQGDRLPPLRIAVAETIAPVGRPHPDCQAAVDRTVALLTDLGHHVEPGCPDWSEMVEPFLAVWRSSISLAGLPPEALGKVNQWLLAHTPSTGDYLRAVSALQQISRRLVGFFETYDLLLTPTYLHPPIRVGQWADLDPEQVIAQVIRWIAPCPPFNATGQPAIALPTGLTAAGLPVGIQLVGRPAEEATIIALAAQLEAAGLGLGDRRPPGCNVSTFDDN